MIRELKRFLDRHYLDHIAVQLDNDSQIAKLTLGRRGISDTIRITYDLINDCGDEERINEYFIGGFNRHYSEQIKVLEEKL